jgi:hypothetical protein
MMTSAGYCCCVREGEGSWKEAAWRVAPSIDRDLQQIDRRKCVGGRNKRLISPSLGAGRHEDGIRSDRGQHGSIESFKPGATCRQTCPATSGRVSALSITARDVSSSCGDPIDGSKTGLTDPAAPGRVLVRGPWAGVLTFVSPSRVRSPSTRGSLSWAGRPTDSDGTTPRRPSSR